MSEIIWAGSRRLLKAIFTDLDTGLQYDPDEVHLVWKRPDSGLEVHRQFGVTVGNQDITNPAVGEYRCRVLLDSYTVANGVWRYRWYNESDDLDEAHQVGFVVVRGGEPPPNS